MSFNAQERGKLLNQQCFLFIADADEIHRRLDRLGSQLKESLVGLEQQPLTVVIQLLENAQFKKLLEIHNVIQAVQCFQCPPTPLCCDAKLLVREVIIYALFIYRSI